MNSNYVKYIREKVGHSPIILNASAAIIEKDRKILAISRGDTEEETWGLPGGMIEIGESAEEAMRREVREETGLEVNIKRFLGVYTNRGIQKFPNADRAQVVFFVFVCEPVGGDVRTDNVEIIDAKYVAPSFSGLFKRHSVVLTDYKNGETGVIR